MTNGAGAPQRPVGQPVRVTSPATFPGPGPLVGLAVTLREVDPERDAAALFDASHGTPEKLAVWTYMPASGPFDDATAMADWLRSARAKEGARFLVVIDNASGRPAGMAAYLNVQPAMRCLELGFIWYTPALQRTRANTETVRLMLGETFDALGYRRAEWKCDCLNAASKAAAERLGFRYEGRFLQHMIVHGRNRDTDWYALTDRDWPRRRRRLDDRLAVAPEPPGGTTRGGTPWSS